MKKITDSIEEISKELRPLVRNPSQIRRSFEVFNIMQRIVNNNKVLNKGSKRKKFDLWPISQAKIIRLNNRILIINITPDF